MALYLLFTALTLINICTSMKNIAGNAAKHVFSKDIVDQWTANLLELRKDFKSIQTNGNNGELLNRIDEQISEMLSIYSLLQEEDNHLVSLLAEFDEISIDQKRRLADDCDCDYHPGGCQISSAASSGNACDCSYMGFWSCSGEEKPCVAVDSYYCRNPDTSIGSCYASSNNPDCGGYTNDCDCDYHSGGCTISSVAPRGTACHCDYKGWWTCGGSITTCKEADNINCDDPNTSKESCQQGEGDCGGY